jgi:hypothetical protein
MVFLNLWCYKDGCLRPVFDDKQDAYPTCKRGGLKPRRFRIARDIPLKGLLAMGLRSNSPAWGKLIHFLFLCGLSVSGAILLILEMYRPFQGLVRISSTPLRNALEHLGQ